MTVPVGEDIGFLPGTEEEKMGPWMGALEDNLDVLNASDESGGECRHAPRRRAAGHVRPVPSGRPRVDPGAIRRASCSWSLVLRGRPRGPREQHRSGALVGAVIVAAGAQRLGLGVGDATDPAQESYNFV